MGKNYTEICLLSSNFYCLQSNITYFYYLFPVSSLISYLKALQTVDIIMPGCKRHTRTEPFCNGVSLVVGSQLAPDHDIQIAPLFWSVRCPQPSIHQAPSERERNSVTRGEKPPEIISIKWSNIILQLITALRWCPSDASVAYIVRCDGVFQDI